MEFPLFQTPHERPGIHAFHHGSVHNDQILSATIQKTNIQEI